jgi:hypothetical protein
MTISTPDASSISAVNLVSLGADTHQADMDQHFVPLSFTANSGSLSVQAPSSGALAPPGYYMLFIVNSAGLPSVAAIVQVLPSQTAPSAPAGVTASAGDGSATVSWTAPSNGGSPITSYTVTPYVGGVAQPATTVTGTPPATSTVITGLSNGTSYTFTVSATNAIGTGPASAASSPVTPGGVAAPAFVQQVSAHGHGSSITATPGAAVTSGDRMIVEVGVWNFSHATATNVTDSAGDTYTELTHFKASDGTEMSVWSAPITSGGTKPAITATAGSSADMGIAAVEYSGLSAAAGSGAVDVQASAAGTTSTAATVTSGATAAVSAAGELALGFYADSGFGNTLTPASGWTARVNVAPTSDMELLIEDQSVGQGAAPAAAAGTGANTIWLMATLVFKHS